MRASINTEVGFSDSFKHVNIMNLAIHYDHLMGLMVNYMVLSNYSADIHADIISWICVGCNCLSIIILVSSKSSSLFQLLFCC